MVERQSKADEEIERFKRELEELEDQSERERESIIQDLEREEQKVKRLHEENLRLQGELMVANEAVRLARSGTISGPVVMTAPGPIYVTPTGECWHRTRTCGNSLCKRPCNPG